MIENRILNPEGEQHASRAERGNQFFSKCPFIGGNQYSQVELILLKENRCNFHMFVGTSITFGAPFVQGNCMNEKRVGGGAEINFTVAALLFVPLNEVY